MNVYSITLVAVLLLGVHPRIAIPQRRLPKAEEYSGATERSTQKEARKLWEQAIAAKGGREKLLSVKHMLVSSRAEYTTHLGKRNSWYQEELSVFPDKEWRWSDMRPDVFGLRIEMFNYASRIGYIVTPDSRKENELRHLTLYKWEESGLVTTQVLYFMETSWVKPVPVAVHQGKVRGQTVDIVQTQVFGKRFDFALDPQTHLPVCISSYDKLITGGEGFTISSVELSQYVEVNGVKIPQKVTPENSSTFDNKVQINVDYNEEIFIKPTTIAAGPEAWRPKTKE